MIYTLQFWSIYRRQATPLRPAFAFVYIKGVHKGYLQHSFRTETYNITYLADPQQNTHEALVKQAIQLSANEWHIPWSMKFK